MIKRYLDIVLFLLWCYLTLSSEAYIAINNTELNSFSGVSILVMYACLTFQRLRRIMVYDSHKALRKGRMYMHNLLLTRFCFRGNF